MTIVVAPDNWTDMQPEVARLIFEHWREIALDHEAVPLDPDWRRYSVLSDAGALLCVSVRDDGVLVGYHLAVLSPHLHYRTTLHAICDIFFLKAEYRQGSTGVKLFRVAEALAKSRGAVKLITASKLHKDVGVIFKRLRYRPTEVVYSKIL